MLTELCETIQCLSVIVQKVHNMSLPSWVNTTWGGQTTYSKLRALESLSFTLEFNQPVLSRLRGGLTSLSRTFITVPAVALLHCRCLCHCNK